VSLACDRNGSRALDAVWVWSSIKIRKGVAEELLEGDKQLKHNRYRLHFKKDTERYSDSFTNSQVPFRKIF
jgi:hypothetical protein